MLTMPVGNILVGNPGGDVKHNDTAFAVDVVTISQSSKFFLTGSIPNVEFEFTEVGEETERATRKDCQSPVSSSDEKNTIEQDETEKSFTSAERFKDNVLNFNTQGGDVLLLKLTSQVALDESGLIYVSEPKFQPNFEVVCRNTRQRHLNRTDDNKKMQVVHFSAPHNDVVKEKTMGKQSNESEGR